MQRRGIVSCIYDYIMNTMPFLAIMYEFYCASSQYPASAIMFNSFHTHVDHDAPTWTSTPDMRLYVIFQKKTDT